MRYQKTASGLKITGKSKGKDIEVDIKMVLVSTGRKPNTDNLNLDKSVYPIVKMV